MTRRYLSCRVAGVDDVKYVCPNPVVTHAPLASPANAEPDLTGDLLGSSRRVLLPHASRQCAPGQSAVAQFIPEPATCVPFAVAPSTSIPSAWLRRLIPWVSGLLLLLVLWQWGSAGWILVKAQLAQWLIAQAWEDQSADGRQASIKPWPWADTHPVARLRMPKEGVDLFVLEGAQGNSLAFGPGHLHGTALPGDGISVIGGHRDTHFRFLRNVAAGDNLSIETRDGRRLTYRIEQRQVVDSRHTPLYLPDYPDTGLVLITCYPFDALDPNGPLRLVVWAREVNEEELGLADFPVEAPDAHPLSFSL